jgi:hypothetical protein
MFRQLTRTLAMTVAALVIALHFAHAGMLATVTTVDNQGVATIKAEDGQEYQVQVEGLQVGDQVEYDINDQGLITIKTSDEQEDQNQAEGMQASTAAECAVKNDQGECVQQ